MISSLYASYGVKPQQPPMIVSRKRGPANTFMDMDLFAQKPLMQKDRSFVPRLFDPKRPRLSSVSSMSSASAEYLSPATAESSKSPALPTPKSSPLAPSFPSVAPSSPPLAPSSSPLPPSSSPLAPSSSPLAPSSPPLPPSSSPIAASLPDSSAIYDEFGFDTRRAQVAQVAQSLQQVADALPGAISGAGNVLGQGLGLGLNVAKETAKLAKDAVEKTANRINDNLQQRLADAREAKAKATMKAQDRAFQEEQNRRAEEAAQARSIAAQKARAKRQAKKEAEEARKAAEEEERLRTTAYYQQETVPAEPAQPKVFAKKYRVPIPPSPEVPAPVDPPRQSWVSSRPEREAKKDAKLAIDTQVQGERAILGKKKDEDKEKGRGGSPVSPSAVESAERQLRNAEAEADANPHDRTKASNLKRAKTKLQNLRNRPKK